MQKLTPTQSQIIGQTLVELLDGKLTDETIKQIYTLKRDEILSSCRAHCRVHPRNLRPCPRQRMADTTPSSAISLRLLANEKL